VGIAIETNGQLEDVGDSGIPSIEDPWEFLFPFSGMEGSVVVVAQMDLRTEEPHRSGADAGLAGIGPAEVAEVTAGTWIRFCPVC